MINGKLEIFRSNYLFNDEERKKELVSFKYKKRVPKYI